MDDGEAAVPSSDGADADASAEAAAAAVTGGRGDGARSRSTPPGPADDDADVFADETNSWPARTAARFLTNEARRYSERSTSVQIIVAAITLPRR